MNQFLNLDNELFQFEDSLQTAGAGPSRLGSGFTPASSTNAEFFRTESTKRVRDKLRSIRQNDTALQRLDEPIENKIHPGGKRKRSNMIVNSSDEEPDTQRTKFSTTGVPPEQEENQDNVDLWWEAMRSGNMIGNGLLPMAQYGFPPIQPNKTRRRKKRQKADGRLGLTGTIHKNISTLHSIRRVHSKILILNAAAEDPSLPIPPMADHDEPEPTRPPIPGLTLAEDSGAHCLHRVSSTILEHAGFEGSSQLSLNVLQHVAADYIMNVGRTFRFMVDKFGHTMSNEQIVLHCLSEHGISEVQDLERYVKDDVERYGSRLNDLERKLTQAYIEQTEASAIEEDGLFDDENEEFALGGFTEDLGEDFFGLRELGLEQEFGLKSLAIPKRLLRGRRDNAANANAANREPPLPYPPPASFIPIHTAALDSHIGLLHPFYASRAGPPPADGSNPAGVILQEDSINPLKVKMGPLGQIVPVVSGPSKKKGGGGNAGGSGGGGGSSHAVAAGGSGPADAGVVKLEVGASKDSKKKKAKAPAPASSLSNELPLTMPTFGAGASKAPVAPAPPPEVSTMMPDFNAFVSGVHAGV
ncbi:bromodomain associated protein [Ceratobasidium sp. AG-Ba]|nr:bromodomain associated protein [Ceratobasidium sp. AG-Ba]